MSDAPSAPRYTVAAAMRNEGAFLVEWVAWYRMLGFDHILVATNDCADPTPEMLAIFEDAGWVIHVPHVPKPHQHPKTSAHRAMRNHGTVKSTEWLMICDVDEFLVIHEGDGTITNYLERRGRGVHGIAFHWRSFGSGGQKKWQDTLVHRAFTQAAPERTKANQLFKSIIRRPVAFKGFGAHSPRRFLGPGVWGEGENVLVDCVGRPLRYYNPNDLRPQMATAASRVRHRAAQMNHYVIRWEESFDLKRGTPSASGGVDRYTNRFHETYNRNDETDRSALTYAERFDHVHAQAMALPGMSRLHHLSCAHYAARLVEAAGQRAEDDLRYLRHLAAAESIEGETARAR